MRSSGPGMQGTRSRGGAVGVVECVVAILVILILVGPLIGMISSSTRSGQVGSRRLVLHLRARRHQAEVVATSFHVLAASSGEFPSTPLEPSDSSVYSAHVADLTESTRLQSVAPDLLQVETSIRFAEPAVRGLVRTVRVRRLVASPTVSLEARWGVRRFSS